MKRITLRPAVEKDAPKIQEIQQSILESHNNVDSIAAIRETMGKKEITTFLSLKEKQSSVFSPFKKYLRINAVWDRFLWNPHSGKTM